MKINYQMKLDKIINDIKNEEYVPTLLLHSCCGPCSSYVLEYLSKYFSITVFYYNPNIYPSNEYWYRVEEQQKIIDLTSAKNSINLITGKYDVERFYNMTKGMEDMSEGGHRCHLCYEMRLREAAKIAQKENFDYFTTTLTISPHKNSQVLNRIGEKVAKEFGVNHLPSDFKKNNGYKRSVEITREAGLYRQDYCGCEYSKREAEIRKIKLEKKKLREDMKELSKTISLEYMMESDKAITDKILNSQEYKKAKNIFCYIGDYPEINTRLFIEKAIEDGKKISVPLCIDNSNMKAYRINSLNDLKEGKFGIPEPDPEISKEVLKSEIDLIIVPCCTVDSNGNRLGFGKGYYDRFMDEYTGNKLLPIRKKQMVDKVPIEEHDHKIKLIITE